MSDKLRLSPRTKPFPVNGWIPAEKQEMTTGQSSGRVEQAEKTAMFQYG
jgi:hypothetical protein